jgi:hypothetical protein
MVVKTGIFLPEYVSRFVLLTGSDPSVLSARRKSFSLKAPLPRKNFLLLPGTLRYLPEADFREEKYAPTHETERTGFHTSLLVLMHKQERPAQQRPRQKILHGSHKNVPGKVQV